MERVINTCKEMIEQRGYVIEDINNECIIGVKGNDKVCVILNLIYKLNVEKSQECISFLQNEKIKHGICIYKDDITSGAKQIIEQLPNMKIEIFCMDELLINITKHKYVPHHIKIDNSVEFKKRYGQKFPIMFKTDPISKFYGYQSGDIIRVIRKDDTVAYRIVK